MCPKLFRTLSTRATSTLSDQALCSMSSTVGRLSPGTHVIAMGSDLLGKRELADDVLLGAALLVADDVSIAGRVGELAHLAEAAERAVDLGDVLTGRSVGRTSDEQITVSDHCGLDIQDAAMAQLVMTGGPS